MTNIILLIILIFGMILNIIGAIASAKAYCSEERLVAEIIKLMGLLCYTIVVINLITW